MKPMLLSEHRYHVDKINSQRSVFIQPKLNGWRAVINTTTGRIYSGTGREIILPHITADIISMMGLPEWIDGELYCHGEDLASVGCMIKKQDRRIKFYCFDAIIQGRFSARILAVMAIRETENIRTVATSEISPRDIDRCYRDYLAQGLEGAVIRCDSEYYHGRSSEIFKLKPNYDI